MIEPRTATFEIRPATCEKRPAGVENRPATTELRPTPEGNDYYSQIKSAGYLPWGGGGECIAAGSSTAYNAWSQWMNSPGHKSILLGFDIQIGDKTNFDYGIGHAFVPGSTWGHYWVAIISSRNVKNSEFVFFQ